jgi:hypothetical protein
VVELQGLWTEARNRLHVTTVRIDNSPRAILEVELERVASVAGRCSG